jgi:DNA-binding NtrC family response regulator
VSPTISSRVLIVDDDEVISGALFQHLVGKGVDTDLALEPVSAERLLRANDYSVVLMDAYLTGQLHKRAIDLVDRVRLLRPASYIVLLTAYGSEELASRMARHARLTIVNKPQPISYIANLIEGLLV